MTSKKGVSVLCLTVVAAVSWLFFHQSGASEIKNLRAAEVPVLPLHHLLADPALTFPESFPLQVAVFWSKPDEGMLGLVHALREMGIPFFVTRDLDQALRHPLVIMYPSADGRTLSDDQVAKLTRHVANGGSLLSFNVSAGALRPLFGFREMVPSRRRHRVIFDANPDPIEKYLNRPEEREVQLGDSKFDEIFWTNGYTPDGTSEALAHFDDGTAARAAQENGRRNGLCLRP